VVSAGDLQQRPGLSSPFGLIADIGAAALAELGANATAIAQALGGGVSDQAARAAAERGRRQLTARRLNPALLRPLAPGPEAAPARPGPRPQVPARAPSSPVREPDTTGPGPDPDSCVCGLEALLEWAEHGGPHQAALLAARARVLHEQIDVLRVAEIRARAGRRAPGGAARARRDEIRAWARENGLPVNPGRIRNDVMAAFERAHRDPEARAADPAAAADGPVGGEDLARVRAWAVGAGLFDPEQRPLPRRILLAYRQAQAQADGLAVPAPG